VSKATRQVVERFKDPWQELVLSYGQGRPAAKEFTAAEDRCLLCLADTFGFGNWAKVKQELYRINAVQPDVFLDYFLLSSTEESLGKRCEYLMRLAERDVAEQEKKSELEADPSKSKDQQRVLEASVEAEERTRLVADLVGKREAEQRKVSEGRKLEQALNEEQGVSSFKDLRTRAHAAGLVAMSKEESPVVTTSAGKGGGSGKKGASSLGKPFPADLVDSLLAFVIAQKNLGVEKATTSFKDAHSDRELTKRSIDDTIKKHLIKDKLNPEKQERWRRMTDKEKSKKADTGGPHGQAAGGATGAEKRKPSESSLSSKKPKSDKDGVGKKRKSADAGGQPPVDAVSAMVSGGGVATVPKEKGPVRAKTSFQFYTSQNKVRSLLFVSFSFPFFFNFCAFCGLV